MELQDTGSELGDAVAGVAWPSSLRQMALSLCEMLGEKGYWAIAISALIAALGTALFFWFRQKDHASEQEHIALFSAFFSALLLVAFRWPTFIHLDLNVDEDFLIAGALALRGHWNYFDALDGTTSGPLNFFPLVFFSLLGMRLEVAAARVIALVLVWLALLCAHTLLRSISSARVAFFGTIVLSLLFGTLEHDGWVHYSSAHVSLLFIVFALSQLGTIIFGRRITTLSAATFALTIAAMPFAKLQSVLFALLFLGWFLVLLFFHVREPLTPRARTFMASGVIAVALCPLLLLAGARRLFWGAENFWISYFQTATHYVSAGAHTLREHLGVAWKMIGTTDEIFYLFLGATICCGLLTRELFLQRDKLICESRYVLILIGNVLIFGILTALAPGRDFTHYLLFLFFPGCVGLVAGAAVMFESYAKTGAGVSRSWLVPAFSIAFCFTMLMPRIVIGHQSFDRQRVVPRVHQSFVSRVILSAKLPDDTLAVWGWCPQLHGQTLAAPGVMDIITQRQIMPSPIREYYRERYINDIKQHKPAFFVDSTGSNPCALDFRDRKRFGHEIVPELEREIDTEYQFLCDQEQLRLYVSYERLVSQIAPEYLYPLIVYLDLTATGNLEYERFEVWFHQLIEKERMRSPRQSMKMHQVSEKLKELTDRVLSDMVAGNLVEPSVADVLLKRAKRVSLQIQERHSLLDSPAVEKLSDPIRMYRRIFQR